MASGVLFGVAAVLRMGSIVQFLSKPVTTGFLFGAAIDVVIGAPPRLTRTGANGEYTWRQRAGWLDAPAVSSWGDAGDHRGLVL